MKVLISLALVVMSGGLCAAQTLPGESAAPGVAVIENGWRRFLARNPALDADPLRPLEAQARAERIRAEVVEQNRINASMGKDQVIPPSRNAPGTLSTPPRRNSHPFRYVYRVKIANTGVKKIREVVWAYAFIDKSTGSEVGNHQFTSKISVSPGKSKNIFGHSNLPPAGSVDATKAAEGPEGQYSERVVITKIYYDDNTVWERAVK